MRLLLAILAVLALLANPVTAAAAQATCAENGGPAAMAGMDMAGMPGMSGIHATSAQSSKGDPCCDHSNHSKKPEMSCAQACATTCGVATAVPAQVVLLEPRPIASTLSSARAISLKPHEPSQLERPPKSI